jgi:Fic family protein
VDHPFGDGNGRVARLIEVQILSESGVIPDVATGLLSDHYSKTRTWRWTAHRVTSRASWATRCRGCLTSYWEERYTGRLY